MNIKKSIKFFIVFLGLVLFAQSSVYLFIHKQEAKKIIANNYTLNKWIYCILAFSLYYLIS